MLHTFIGGCIMTQKLPAVMLVGLLIGAGGPGRDANKQKKDEEQIVGLWTVVSRD